MRGVKEEGESRATRKAAAVRGLLVPVLLVLLGAVGAGGSEV